MTLRLAGMAGLMALASAMPVLAASDDELSPYKMMRSLQYVQDTVVAGDHSASEMQKFMLGAIDKRLRTAPPGTFSDPRNIDAALIYAMSGGNPATLEYLASRDIEGNFDSRLADSLRKYLKGKGQLASKDLAALVDEYQDKPIGPYLALVTGNTFSASKPEDALHFYDIARLTAPGTIIEEAALRRSLSIAVTAKLPDKAIRFARAYARRFIHSPYASQFADLVVSAVLDNYEAIGKDGVTFVLEPVDVDRQREVWLRIARRAAIAGKAELAMLAAQKAQALADTKDSRSGLQASLYDALAKVRLGEMEKAQSDLEKIPDAALSLRDRALKAAGTAIASATLQMPVDDSLRQASPLIDETSPMVGHDAPTEPGKAQPQDTAAQPPAGSSTTPPNPNAPAPPAGPSGLDGFVTDSRSKLAEIDKLIAKDVVRQ